MFVIIVYHIKARRGLNFTRSAVLHPRLAPWNRLLNFDDELSILEMTGFSRQAFMLLESVCFPEESIIRRVGRPSSIDNRGKLGLYLFFVGSRMSVKHLYLIFGLVQTSACVFINEMLKLVVCKLKKHPVSAIRYPTDDILI